MRCIDADHLIGLVKDATILGDGFKQAFIAIVRGEPTIEPERKVGKWIDSHTTCSECGWQMIDDVTESPNIVGFNFCPRCGCAMTEEGENE